MRPCLAVRRDANFSLPMPFLRINAGVRQSCKCFRCPSRYFSLSRVRGPYLEPLLCLLCVSVRGQASESATFGRKKAPDDAGAFQTLISRDQYLATTAPPQLKR